MSPDDLSNGPLNFQLWLLLHLQSIYRFCDALRYVRDIESHPIMGSDFNRKGHDDRFFLRIFLFRYFNQIQKIDSRSFNLDRSFRKKSIQDWSFTDPGTRTANKIDEDDPGLRIDLVWESWSDSSSHYAFKANKINPQRCNNPPDSSYNRFSDSSEIKYRSAMHPDETSLFNNNKNIQDQRQAHNSI